MRYKDKVISLIDAAQNRVDNMFRSLENNAPNTREQFMAELKTLSSNLEYISNMVGTEDNDFAALEGRMR